jgi:hypothetical protein
LSVRKGISAAILRELEELPEDPDLLLLCPQAAAALNSVHQEIFSLIHPTLPAAAEAIRELDALFGSRAGDRALATFNELPAAPPLTVPHVVISPRVFEYARGL